jgi:5-methylcytosine-specific restriction endonuclease McrA
MQRRRWFARGRHSPETPQQAPMESPKLRGERLDDFWIEPSRGGRLSSALSRAAGSPPGKRNTRLIPQDVKIEVAARDGGRCRQCGSNKELHFDHATPWSKGGANTADNIQLLCGTCNRRKGADEIPVALPLSPYRQAWRPPAAYAQSSQPPASHKSARPVSDTAEQEWQPTCPDCGVLSALHTGALCPGRR